MSAEDYSFAQPPRATLEALSELKSRLDGSEYSLGNELKYSRFTKEFVGSVAYLFPSVQEGPVPIEQNVPELICEYLSPYKQAEVTIKPAHEQLYPIASDDLLVDPLKNQSGLVLLTLPNSNNFPSSLIFTFDAAGMKVQPLVSYKNDERLPDFVADFGEDQEILSKMACQLSLEAAFSLSKDELNAELDKL